MRRAIRRVRAEGISGYISEEYINAVAVIPINKVANQLAHIERVCLAIKMYARLNVRAVMITN
tara:strand:+ start:889 stop:1077 length:189 start_codon:yes stop_codon:yes gene_type:complete